MARPDKDEIRSRLRQAVVQQVVTHGIGATSMAGVAAQARLSPGTIYLHFKNKEDLLQQVYLEVKAEFHAKMLAAENATTSHDMIRQMWFSTFDFVLSHPNDFTFIEYAGTAQLLTSEQTETVGAMREDILKLLQRAIDDDTLAPLPVTTVSVLLVAPAMQLARNIALSGKKVSPETIEQTFDRVWLSISAD